MRGKNARERRKTASHTPGRHGQVEVEQSLHHRALHIRRHAEARLPARVCVEIVPRIEIVPAVARQDRRVQRRVQPPQVHNVGITAGGIVDQVVRLRQPDLARLHDLPPPLVVRRPDLRRMRERRQRQHPPDPPAGGGVRGGGAAYSAGGNGKVAKQSVGV